MQESEIEEAQKLYQNVLLAFPKNGRAQKGLAALNKSNQPKATQSPPQETINQLIDLYNQGQLWRSLSKHKALQDNILMRSLSEYSGGAAAQTGQIDEAINAFKRVIAIKPDYAEAHSSLGNVLKDRCWRKHRGYNKALSLKPDYAEAYNNMGNILMDQGSWKGRQRLTTKPYH